MNNFDNLIQAVRSCTPEQKQRIFSEIRESILIHKLEQAFNVRAEVILEAISRASDLTQRGVRGVISETVFVMDVIPTLQGWQNEAPVGNMSYDACLVRGARRIRIQAKMQRKEKGKPMLRGGSHIVEVQRTRTGNKAGVTTRPYRFGEFDLLAVCMQASTGDWHSFMYVPANNLTPDHRDAKIIKTFQAIPSFDNGDHGVWTKDLSTALERVS